MYGRTNVRFKNELNSDGKDLLPRYSESKFLEADLAVDLTESLYFILVEYVIPRRRYKLAVSIGHEDGERNCSL